MAGQAQRQQPGLACEECRRKRIRCDRGTPQCMACATSGVTCVVRDSCPPRGPKKGYLKTLQKRIEDLQTQLEKQQGTSTPTAETRAGASSTDNNDIPNTTRTSLETPGNVPQWPAQVEFQLPLLHMEPWGCFDGSFASSPFPSLPSLDNLHELVQIPKETDLLITPMMHNDLDQLYFDRAYAFAPIIQTHRYRSWSKQPHKSKQKTCLQHAMWTLASSLSSQFQDDGRKLYVKTRQLLQALESEEPCHQISLEQAQAWTLLAIYELTCQDFHRGMMSAGRAFRLIQMMRLYELDVPQKPPTMQLEQYQGQLTLQGPVQDDWIDIETKRRTFWLAYTIDRFTSMVDGLHMFFNERLIRTRLPAPEANFASGRPTDMSFLSEMIPVVDLEWPHNNLSSFSESVIGATICGRVLEHKQKPPTRPCQEFCHRHRQLNALLAQRIRMLRLYASLEYPDPIIAFVTLAAHIGVLMLYDLIESRPLGTDAQGTQLTQALYTEHKQQALDSVADIALLIAVLGQHFQMHPLTPILLLLGARFSQSHPGLNDAYIKLMPSIVTTLQASTGLNKLAQNFLQLLEPQNDTWCALP
ncbi:putative fungal-specific transcription factor [Aspergillus sclerotiicarbonarius CBS 121057]|uniref:Putative fungal-specific transcription factor n=1 Tax=Aspergillus sclerotiicarbonarius (strain CBS 121057 / IBT 28362) TaxID=1448318 RepID=A0A319DX75_ASPSB|nr:putative fungal-specific transcription factor [Aspergillus sclerotiicarbonarius CBS 121057]